MSKIYKKANRKNYKRAGRIVALIFLLAGLGIFLYSFFPVISWQIYFAPLFASQNIQAPIPKTTVLDQRQIETLITSAKRNLSLDYTNAQNWFPNFNPKANKQKTVEGYNISIPAINIQNAKVSTVDYDLSSHLVNYDGTALPPYKGNAVIFGHSTLPQLYNPKDYKTIFANAYKLKTGDDIFIYLPGISYKYKVTNVYVVEADDTTPLEQNFSDSFVTLITCTPPGTVWKRLIIKGRLEKI